MNKQQSAELQLDDLSLIFKARTWELESEAESLKYYESVTSHIKSKKGFSASVWRYFERSGKWLLTIVTDEGNDIPDLVLGTEVLMDKQTFQYFIKRRLQGRLNQLRQVGNKHYWEENRDVMEFINFNA